MKKLFLFACLFVCSGLSHLSAQSSNDEWPAHKAKKWFKKKEWLNGLDITPHSSIDKEQFAKQ
ncbi:MAG TPA: hypothetical protein VFL47_03835, partial [Flavisolibacter sp.]|nr:hypothetical protein [Flavisolibacter sp.]